jgi:hypothetical protein
MSEDESRRLSAGGTVQDHCASCKTLRRHTVLATPASGGVARVICDFCGSQHNFRGGRGSTAGGATRAAGESGEPFALVAAREGSGPEMSDLEQLLRRVIREECGLTPVVPADKWRGGEMILRPGKPGLQEKAWPIETFFHKIVMLRNRLRVLEQQVNSLPVEQDLKVKLQGYLTACYGSLTSFNVLFASDEDRFRGAGGGASGGADD